MKQISSINESQLNAEIFEWNHYIRRNWIEKSSRKDQIAQFRRSGQKWQVMSIWLAFHQSTFAVCVFVSVCLQFFVVITFAYLNGMIYRPQSNGYLVHREQKTNTANQQQQQQKKRQKHHHKCLLLNRFYCLLANPKPFEASRNVWIIAGAMMITIIILMLIWNEQSEWI